MIRTPESLTQAAALMEGYPAQWALCGGWAVDAWLGEETREHGDVDLTIWHDEQHHAFTHLSDLLLNGHDVHDGDGTEPWTGRTLEFPSHIHGYGDDGIHLDIQLNRRGEGRWIFSTKKDITLPLSECFASAWGLPVLAPQVVLFFKVLGGYRDKDEDDFRKLVPLLDPVPHAWLHDAVVKLKADHAWLDAFG